MIALLTLFGVVFSSVMAYLGVRYSRRAAKSAQSVDDAVNHRHPSEPRLLDIVKAIRDHQLRQDDRLDTFDMKLDLVHTELKAADAQFMDRGQVIDEVRHELDREKGRPGESV